jgi:outer membrane lipoprotein SlyB
MNLFFKTPLILLLVAILGACASSSPDVIQRGDTQRMAKVEDGVVLTVRNVVVEGSQSGIGATIGGVTGAVAGYSASSVQREGQVLGLLIGAAGAVAGNAVERFGSREEAVEILVALKGGERRAIVQGKGGEVLVPGDAVILVTTGNKIRVTKAPS